MSITAALARHASERGDATALACEDEALSFAELDALVARCAAHLAQAPEGGIALHLPTGPVAALLFLAAARAGREAQVLDPAWPAALAGEVVAALKPAVLFSTEAVAERAVRLDPKLPAASVADTIGAPAAFRRPDEPDPRRPFYVGFTSGSTGVPKGYRRDHASWTASFAADAAEFGVGPGDVVLAPGTLTHSLFLYALAHGLHAGAKVVLARRFRPNGIAALVRRHGATVLYGVPTQLAVTLDALEAAGAPPLDGIRRILSSGAKWFAGEKERVRRHFPKARFAEFYGASELSFVTVAKEEDEVPEASVGRAFAGVSVTVRDRAGRRLPPGRTGLVHVESPFLFSGYALGGDADLTRAGSAVSVGDMGRLDENGFLFLAGRAKRMIVTSGKNLYPEEVERLLSRHAAVAAAAVLGVADARRGERLVALLDIRGEAPSRAELIAALRPHLPLFKIPRIYGHLAAWPLTPSGKTDFAAVARLWPDGAELLP